MAKRRWRKASEGPGKCTVLYLPSQLSPVWSSEKPRWHSQTKLPGVFWQMPFAPHKLISVAHSLLSEGNQSLSVTFLPCCEDDPLAMPTMNGLWQKVKKHQRRSCLTALSILHFALLKESLRYLRFHLKTLTAAIGRHSFSSPSLWGWSSSLQTPPNSQQCRSTTRLPQAGPNLQSRKSVLQEVFNISTDITGMWLKDNCRNVCVMLIVSRSLCMISNVGPAMNYRNRNIIIIFAQWVRKGKARIPSWCFHCLLLASAKFKDRDYENKGRRDGLFASSPLAGLGSETG